MICQGRSKGFVEKVVERAWIYRSAGLRLRVHQIINPKSLVGAA